MNDDNFIEGWYLWASGAWGFTILTLLVGLVIGFILAKR